MGRLRRAWLGSFIAIVLVLSAGMLFRDRVLRAREAPLLPEVLYKQRLLPARLAARFEYVPYAPVTRGSAEQPANGLDQAVAEAGQRIQKLLERNSADVDLLAARAVLLLAQERSGNRLEKALAELEAARAHAPTSAKVLSDLSAVYFSLAVEQDEPNGVLNALAAADRALAIDPTQLEALFNRSLFLEYLGLWPQARAAWWAYLEQDGDSGWGAEAREHYIALAQVPSWDEVRPAVLAAAGAGDLEKVARLIGPLRTAARRDLEERLLPEWAAAHRDSGPAAAQLLAAAQGIASTLHELGHDRLYLDTVATIEEAAADPDALDVLAAAHRGFGLGVAAIQKGRIDEAMALLTSARDGFARAGSPFADRAELKLAICEQGLQQYPAAEGRLRSVVESVAGREYSNLLGEAYWMMGLCHNDTGQLAEAVEAYRRAVPLFEELGDIDNLAGVHMLLAERLALTGETAEAWAHLHSALALSRTVTGPKRLREIYAVGADLTERAGFLAPAILFQDIALENARLLGNPLAIAEALRWRARLHGAMDDREAAERDLDAARATLPTIPQQEDRERAEAWIRVAEAELEVSVDAVAAADHLEAAVDSFRRSGSRIMLPSALLALGGAWIAAGDDERARGALDESLRLTEEFRGRLPSERERVSFLQLAEEAFDRRIALELRRGDRETAFAVSESKRARTLLDRLDPGPNGAGLQARNLLGAREISRRLPPDRMVVEYAQVGGKLSAWLLANEGLRWVPLGDSAAVERKVDLFLRDLARRAPEERLKSDAADLYRDLIAPLGPIAGGRALVVVPDGPLYALPFAALFDAASGRYLIERRPLAYAPSANLYLRAVERDRFLPRQAQPSALLLGNPDFDEAVYRDLRPLPGAEGEINSIATLYPRAELATGSRATERLFLARAGRCEIVHFAGHAVVYRDDPGRSRLLLAADAADPEHGALLADEIYGRRLPQTRLVVLGACSTADGPLVSGEGVASLARPFLAAGVPGVVASLWPVEDRATSGLLVAFHRRLAVRRDALHALQGAQVAFLSRPEKDLRSPATWAAFQLLGEASFAPSPVE